MDWYKRAIDIDTFKERNLINAKIRDLNKMSERLVFISDLVFQTARGAKRMLEPILDDKRLSSYPAVLDLLRRADSLAMDSPWRFSTMCKESAGAIQEKVKRLERDRHAFVESTESGNKVRKGLVY